MIRRPETPIGWPSGVSPAGDGRFLACRSSDAGGGHWCLLSLSPSFFAGGLRGEVAVTDVYPTAADFEIHGIDVSRYQGDIDWNAVREFGVRFAWIKATEGGDLPTKNSPRIGRRRKPPVFRAAPIISLIGAARAKNRRRGS